MQYYINGGIYRVQFAGNTNSEFAGEHPAIIIRTLRENDIYLVCPLTTYTKEKWGKARKKGFGYHIKSTNSIARIDKIQIIHHRDIKNRWLANNDVLRVIPDELKELNAKLQNYIQLSGEKCNKEYTKYDDQYKLVLSNLRIALNPTQAETNIFSVIKNDNQITLKCHKSNINSLSLTDVNMLLNTYRSNYNVSFDFTEDFLSITLLVKNT